MLTYKTLYRRIRESTGMDVLTPGTLQTIIENAMADLSSRGYRNFEEKVCVPQRPQRPEEFDEVFEALKPWMFESLGHGLYKLKYPEDCRRILYLKIATQDKMYNSLRLSITDDRINNKSVGGGQLRSSFIDLEKDSIFYSNGNDLFIEMRDELVTPLEIRLGYDKKIMVPDEPELEDYENFVIDIRREFEDALVLYGVYFIYNRYVKEVEKVQAALNNYKYYVEDIKATLSHEDDYTRPQGVQLLERM